MKKVCYGKNIAGRKDRCRRPYLAAVLVFTLFLGGVGLGCGKKSSEKPYDAHGV